MSRSYKKTPVRKVHSVPMAKRWAARKARHNDIEVGTSKSRYKRVYDSRDLFEVHGVESNVHTFVQREAGRLATSAERAEKRLKYYKAYRMK